MRFYTLQDVANFGQTSFKYIKTSLNEHVFTVTLNRPEKRNALNSLMQKEIVYALAYAHYEENVRCVVLNAEGSVFCAGVDLQSFNNSDKEESTVPEPALELTLADAFSDLNKPCIAQVEGAVLAGGFLLIAGCHFVISTTNSTYGLPEVKRGLWPMQVMEALTSCLTPRQIMQMCILGKSYTAEEMQDWGLVTRLVSEERIHEEVEQLAKSISENAPLAIKSGMQAFQKMYELRASERQLYLKSQLNHLLESEDAQEGIAAFLEKRKPVWNGK